MLTRLDEWVDGPDDTRWVLVTGGPGMGKSAILAAWLARRETSSPVARRPIASLIRDVAARLGLSKTTGARNVTSTVVAHHFIRRQVADWDQPEVIAASLAAQIETALPALRDPKARPEQRLVELLGRVSKQLGARQRFVIVIDGLDETHAKPGENPLPRFLPHAIPSGICFLCATRPTYPHLDWIAARNAVRRLDLDSPQWASSNVAVVRGFWESVAPEYRPPLPAETTAAAIARADGNVLHAIMLHDALRDLPVEQRRADRIPRGLQALISDVWDQAASHEAVRTGLGLLCAAQEALSLDMLAELAGWSYDDKQRFVRDARQLLLEEPASWAGVDAYRPRHDWMRELIAERLGAATLRAHHAALSRTLATWPPPSGASERRYALRHGLIHHAEAGDWANAWKLAADMSFLEAKCRELGVHETEIDVARMADRCGASGDPTLAWRFDDLARAIGRESHWLRTTPEATAALVWNRLRRFGWSAEDLDSQLRVPLDADFLRVQHAATHESPALVRDLAGHSDSVTACAVMPDGRRVVSASGDGTLRLWDLDSGRALATFEGHAGGVTTCAVTPDGRRVVSGAGDGALKLWDLDSGRALATFEGHAGGVTACVVTPDGRCVVSVSGDGTLRLWDLDSGRALATFEGHAGGVTTCAVTPDGRRVVSGTEDGTLKIWDLDSGRALATLEGHAGGVTACAVTPDGRRAVSGAEDGALKIWDLDSGRALATLEGHAGGVTACAVTPDGRRVVSGSQDRTLKIWDLDSGRAPSGLEAHAGRVTACTVTPDGQRVVSGAYDGALMVWDLESGHTLATLEGHAGAVTACAMTPDGRRVVSTAEDATLKVWDLESERLISSLEGHAGAVTACAVTPDGRRVVSAAEDRTLKIWDLESESKRALATWTGHAGGVTACAATPDGRHVVSASEDGTLKIWDLESGRALATLEGHADSVMACTVTPDGRHMVSASGDRMIRVWDLHTYSCLITHRGDAGFVAVAAGATTIHAADAAGTLWFLEWPSSHLLKRDRELQETSRAASRRLLARGPVEIKTGLAARRYQLSSEFATLDQREVTSASAQEALARYRALAAEDPGEFQPVLARSLGVLGARLSALQQPEAALAAVREATDLYRTLATRDPTEFQPELARSLNDLSSRLIELEQRESALAAICEALDLYRMLAAGNPAIESDLAESLNKLSAILSDLGQHDAALAAIQEALEIDRRLARRDPDAFQPDLARNLTRQGAMLRKLGQRESALAAIAESVELYDALATNNPDAFQGERATSLIHLGNILHELGRGAPALATTRDAVELLRVLAARHPDAFEPELAMSLNKLGMMQTALGQHALALATLEEAVTLYRPLAARTPHSFQPELATILNSLGTALSTLGQREAALAATREAMELHRHLVARDPNTFEPLLASTLNDLSARLGDLGQHEDALTVTREVADLYRTLAARDPGVFQAKLIASSSSLSHATLLAESARFLRAAGFTLTTLGSRDNFDTSSELPFWKAKLVRPRLVTHVLLEATLIAADVLRIWEDARHLSPDISQGFVVFDGVVDNAAWLQIATLRAQGFNLMPITASVLYDARAKPYSNAEQEVLSRHLERFLGRGIDPYDVHDPVSDGLNFFGREAIANTLLLQLSSGEPIGLFGLRKMGKSSLLRFIQSKLDFPAARLDLLAGVDPAVLLPRALKGWSADSQARFGITLSFGKIAADDTFSLDNMAYAIREVLDRNAKQFAAGRLGLILDEIELITPPPNAPYEVIERRLSFLRALRGLIQEDGRLSLLVAGVNPAINRTNRWGVNAEQNPFYQFLRETYLGPLAPADCVQMARNIGCQVDLTYSQDATDMITSESGGHPFVARQFCSLAYSMRDGAPGEIGSSELKRASLRFLSDPKYADFWAELWKELTHPALWGEAIATLNKEVLWTLSRVDRPMSSSEIVANSEDAPRLAALHELERKYVVQRAPSSQSAESLYKLQFDFFARWIRQNIPRGR